MKLNKRGKTLILSPNNAHTIGPIQIVSKRHKISFEAEGVNFSR